MTRPPGGGVDRFAESRQQFETVLGWLDSADAGGLEHAELERRLEDAGRELLRRLLQDHLDLRAHREPRVEVLDCHGVAHRAVETGHRRWLTSVFGAVAVDRLAYRRRGHHNLHPADAVLNLPVERHSHGLRRLAAIEAARGSFDATVAALERATGQRVGKRQVEQLTAHSAVDFEAFYATRQPPAGACGESTDLLVLSCDGKGVVMRPEALRAATAAAAATTSQKLATRLSKGEKRNRKRLAEVGAVYDATPVPRGPTDVLPAATSEPAHEPAHDSSGDQASRARKGPIATGKWLTASLARDAASVVADLFDEAERRDPDHTHTLVALVDGNNHQIDRITTEAGARGVEVNIVIDFVHVLEYLWKAAWCFHDEADPNAETWVQDKARQVLAGHATRVAAAIRRKATYHRLTGPARKAADTAAGYLTRKARYLDYPTALTRGWPIATGVIEGACRHLVKDRMDITGARWGLPGAEAILKLRALTANHDFDEYWRFHLAQERRRVHEPRYAQNSLPQAA
ncbi:MAG: ISKra4 family transposase [Actinomycetota bacterium]|nr:ISKra4 family transposase [Actinomycetota bacterium]